MTEHKLDALRHGRGETTGPNTVDLSGLDDDLADLLKPYVWLGELKLGTMKSWSQDLFWDLWRVVQTLQAERDAMRLMRQQYAMPLDKTACWLVDKPEDKS